MPEMSGKCKSNPIKTNNLIYIMIFFQGGVNKIKKFTPPHAQTSVGEGGPIFILLCYFHIPPTLLQQGELYCKVQSCNCKALIIYTEIYKLQTTPALNKLKNIGVVALPHYCQPVSLLSDFPKDLIYIPCGISQDWIVRLPSLNALHNKKEDSKVPNVYFSEPSI